MFNVSKTSALDKPEELNTILNDLLLNSHKVAKKCWWLSKEVSCKQSLTDLCADYAPAFSFNMNSKGNFNFSSLTL